jgi:hypothetical protein
VLFVLPLFQACFPKNASQKESKETITLLLVALSDQTFTEISHQLTLYFFFLLASYDQTVKIYLNIHFNSSS